MGNPREAKKSPALGETGDSICAAALRLENGARGTGGLCPAASYLT